MGYHGNHGVTDHTMGCCEDMGKEWHAKCWFGGLGVSENGVSNGNYSTTYRHSMEKIMLNYGNRISDKLRSYLDDFGFKNPDREREREFFKSNSMLL